LDDSEQGKTMEQEARPQMTLAEAAADTGLDAGFLEWALNAGLLQGTRDADSSWHLPYDAAPTSPLRDPVDDDMKESGTAGAAVAEDVARLHRQLADRDLRLAEKDRVIAALGTSIARLGEAAAQRLGQDR